MGDLKISLAAARVNAGMSQEQLCKVLRVSKTTLCNWEKGYKEPTYNAVRRVSELSGIPMEYIFVPEN